MFLMTVFAVLFSVLSIVALILLIVMLWGLLVDELEYRRSRK